MCTRIIGFNLNIFVSTGSKTTKYKEILEEEIKTQALGYNIIEDLSDDDIVEIESKMGPAHNQYHRRNDGYGYDYSRGGYS